MVRSILSANSKKKIIFLLALIVQISRGDKDCKKEVDYYEKLINDGIEESKKFQLPTDATEFKPTSDTIAGTKFYDFVIVGAGTTGSVIAKRLSEINDWTILLLEAGDMPSNFSLIPRMAKYVLHSKYNWNYQSTVQKNACLDTKDKRCAIPRGKMFGGTSGIDFLMYKRGSKKDYDRWAENGNTTGWSAKDVFPYFLMSENCQLDGDPGHHGKGGEWNTKWHNRPNKRLNAFMGAYNELFTCNPIDYHGKADQLGLFYTQFSGTRNIRNNAALRYLKSKPNNVEIKLNAYVTKILIYSPAKLAYGVEYVSGGKRYIAVGRREIILSAGVINTPQLLMLSGVGPKSVLDNLNISVISDLPVGKTLLSQPFYKVLVNTNIPTPAKDLRGQIVDYLNMFGNLITPISNYGLGYFQTSKNNDPDGYPDINLIIRTSLKDVKASNDSKNDYAMKLILVYLNSKSIGSIYLSSTDPYEYPQIDPNVYNEADDLDGMYEGIQVIMKLLDTNAIKKINATIVYPNPEQCKSYTQGSKDYWYCVFKLYSKVATLSGSCKMGPDSKSSVVNRSGRVYGITNLRIADASIIPVSITGGLTAPCLMIGEKMSNIIKDRYNKKTHTNYTVFD